KVRFERRCAMRFRPISFFSGTVLRAMRVLSMVPMPRMTAPPGGTSVRLHPNDTAAAADETGYINVVDDHQTLLCVRGAEIEGSGLLRLCLRDPRSANEKLNAVELVERECPRPRRGGLHCKRRLEVFHLRQRAAVAGQYRVSRGADLETVEKALAQRIMERTEDKIVRRVGANLARGGIEIAFDGSRGGQHLLSEILFDARRP